MLTRSTQAVPIAFAIIFSTSACQREVTPPLLNCRAVSHAFGPAIASAKEFLIGQGWSIVQRPYCVEVIPSCAHCRTKADVLVMFQPRSGGNGAGAVIDREGKNPPLLQVVQ